MTGGAVTGDGSGLTAGDRETLQLGAVGAVVLVCAAEPGVVAMLRESFAASGALAGGSRLVREVLTAGPAPQLARDPAAAQEQVLAALRRSVEILAVKAPDEVADYRATVLDAVGRAAAAVGGVTADEGAVLDRVRAALAPVS